MTLDLVTAQRLREPTRWEWEQYVHARGTHRQDWSRILDEALLYRHDDAALRKVEEYARREEYQRKLWFAPAPAVCGAPRPSAFRCTFRKNIGGVSGESDVWIDGGNQTNNGSKVGAIVDYVDGAHTFSQSTDATKVAVPAADALFGNSLTFAFAGAQYYISSRALALWKFTQDGTPSTCISVYVATAAGSTGLWGTYAGSATGSVYLINGTTGAATWAMRSGGNVVFNAAIANAALNGTALYTRVSYAEGAGSPEYSGHLRGSSIITGDSLIAPSAGNPANTMYLGSQGAGLTPTNARLRAVYWWHDVPTAAQWTLRQQFIQADTGLTP